MITTGRSPCDEGVLQSGEPRDGCPRAARPYVLAATILGSSMAFIDGTVVNVALPAIQVDLGASVGAMQWIVNGYLLTLGALLLVGGAAGDRFGRRRMFMLGTIVFAIASAACALAPTSLALIVARAVQGVGGALLVPGSLALISASFPKAVRGRAIGTWAGFAALTTAAGPLLGGWLIDTLSWRAIFFVNLPLAAVCLVLAARFVPESRDETGAPGLDWSGALLAVLAFGALTFGFIRSSELGYADAAVPAALLAGGVLLLLFVRHEGRAQAPMMPLALFRSRTFSAANLLTLLLYAALSAVLFVLPFNLMQVQRFSAFEAGAAFLPFTLIMGLASRWTGGLVERFGARPPLVVGPVITGLGFGALALPGSDASYWTGFFPAMVLLGVGMAISVAPLTTTVMNAVAERHTGVASGINNAASRIAGLLAVAVLGSLAVGIFRPTLETRLERLELPAPLVETLLDRSRDLASIEVPAAVAPGQARDIRRAIEDAFLTSFRAIMLVTAGLALLGAACSALLIRAPPEAAPQAAS